MREVPDAEVSVSALHKCQGECSVDDDETGLGVSPAFSSIVLRFLVPDRSLLVLDSDRHRSNILVHPRQIFQHESQASYGSLSSLSLHVPWVDSTIDARFTSPVFAFLSATTLPEFGSQFRLGVYVWPETLYGVSQDCGQTTPSPPTMRACGGLPDCTRLVLRAGGTGTMWRELWTLS